MCKIADTGTWQVYLTKHGLKRSKQRRVDREQMAAMILWLGNKRLESLNGEDIIVECEHRQISIVASVKAARVDIITVVPRANRFKTDIRKTRIKIA